MGNAGFISSTALKGLRELRELRGLFSGFRELRDSGHKSGLGFSVQG